MYDWKWDEDTLFGHTIKIKAHDEYGNTAFKTIDVLIFNFGLIP